MLILDVNLMIFPINEIFQQYNNLGFGKTPAKPVIKTFAPLCDANVRVQKEGIASVKFSHIQVFPFR